jgi:hypothetical protein
MILSILTEKYPNFAGCPLFSQWEKSINPHSIPDWSQSPPKIYRKQVALQSVCFRSTSKRLQSKKFHIFCDAPEPNCEN